jgi:hypothetical protein
VGKRGENTGHYFEQTGHETLENVFSQEFLDLKGKLVLRLQPTKERAL